MARGRPGRWAGAPRLHSGPLGDHLVWLALGAATIMAALTSQS
ncbi:hypothetical protein AB0D08_40130 [Kitasatospora sp. NPDC048540]